MFIKITDDVYIAEKTVVAIVKNRQEIFGENGRVIQHNIYVYLKECPVPITFSTEDTEEVERIYTRLMEA